MVGLLSAISQGKTAVAAIGIVAKKPDQFGKATVSYTHLDVYKRQEYMFHVMRDHGGYPYSICYHPEEKEPSIETMAGNYSLVMDTTEKTAYFCAGQPCEGEFKEYRI